MVPASYFVLGGFSQSSSCLQHMVSSPDPRSCFKLLLLFCISVWFLLCCLFKGRDSALPSLPELSLLTFKFHPSGFQSLILQGFIFFMWVPCAWGASGGRSAPLSSLHLLCPFIHQIAPWVCVVPDYMPALPTLFNMAPSLNLAVKFVLLLFRSFSGLLTLMWVLSSCIHESRWA